MDLARRILTDDPLPILPPPPITIPSHHLSHRTANLLFLSAAVLTVILLLSLTYFLLLRRRNCNNHTNISLSAVAPQPPPQPPLIVDIEIDPSVHHIWLIKTPGLEPHTINSLPTTTYTAQSTPTDCTVCLTEFRYGDLLRHLPSCRHSFHQSCIDTWLASHLTCPLCRSLVVDPVISTALNSDDSMTLNTESTVTNSDSTGLNCDSEAINSNSTTSASNCDLSTVGGGLETGVGAGAAESSASVRRVASMGAVFMGKGSGRRGGFEIGRSFSSSGRGFFFGRNGRARNSVLPI